MKIQNYSDFPRFAGKLHGVPVVADFKLHGALDPFSGDATEKDGIVFRRSDVPVSVNNRRNVAFQKSEEGIFLPLDEIGIPAQYWIRESPHEIVCCGDDEATLANFALFHALPMALVWRGDSLVLRANAVFDSDHGATLIAGGPGTGKSTLAGFLSLEKNHTPVTEDFCVVRREEAGFQVWPGPAGIKLWPEAAMALGLAPDDLSRVRPGVDRFVWRGESAKVEPIPIRRVLDLRWDRRVEKPELEALAGVEKIKTLRNCLWQPRRWPELDRDGASDFAELTNLAADCEMFTLKRSQLGDIRADLEYVAELLA